MINNFSVAEMVYMLPQFSFPEKFSLDDVMDYGDKIFRLVKELFDIHWGIGGAAIILAVGAIVFLLHLAAAAFVAFLAFSQ
ncbi:MAG: hypothetical protein FH758_11330 [Firmicutes bacterium]|nr:hypothetical protein [Bacillota bacterium]